MKDLLARFSRSGKEWLGLWSFIVLLLCVYAVLTGRDVPEGVVNSFGVVLVCYTGNRSLKDWAGKAELKPKGDRHEQSVDNPDA